ncbi:hypothetical protein SCALM49S_06247 [Streptomyces californicus]
MLTLLGWVLTEEGRAAEAAALLEHSPRLAREAGDPLGEATALINLAGVRAELGELPAATENCARAVELARREEDRHTEMLALQHLARMRLTARRPEEALAHARTALDLGPEHEEAARRSLLLAIYGEAHLALGQEDDGVRLLDRAAREAGGRRRTPDRTRRRAWLYVSLIATDPSGSAVTPSGCWSSA